MGRPAPTLALAALLVTAGCTVAVEETATTADRRTAWTVTVERVVDGDTLDVEFPDGHTEDVRLLGVDTPEVHADTAPAEFEGVPDSEAGRAWLREYGERASAFARDRLAGREVRIETDPAADRRGGYGRLLVYVYANGSLFNRALLDRGYARLYESAFGERESFAAAETRARENGVGLWGFERSTAAALAGHSRLVSIPSARFTPQKQVTALNPSPSAPAAASRATVRRPLPRARRATPPRATARTARRSRSRPPTFRSVSMQTDGVGASYT